ncbi:CSLREA domain-containing protein [Dokdonella immobilis]|uniref:CSLREA domain-containing protein n=1 Tax=Dokdonella immobilis TaxID=578942 RepID=A0A1I4V119_9GAMM|nr:CSLREA domain-containing protein [Dokdonella immobilis]SFM94924.1 CSLREA domain-containing protein [Dokdonella immobilis]
MNLRSLGPGLAMLVASAQIGATTIEVSTPFDQFGEDATKCSLREAVQAANTNATFGGCPAGSSADIITFQGFSNHFTLSRPGRDEDANATGDLDVDGSGAIVFVGNGSGKTIIDGDGVDRVFDLDCRSDMNVQFNSLTIVSGDAGNSNGGGIYDCAGALSLYQVHMSENSANQGGALTIASSPIAGNVTVTRSAFTRNHALTGPGSAIRHGGNDLLKLTNTTLSENDATGSGALYAEGDVALKNVTVAYNTGASTGGVYIAGGTARFDNSIFSDNVNRNTSSSTAVDLRCVPTALSDGYNLWKNGVCTFAVNRATDLAGTDPLLGTLADAGRSRPVHVLLPGSPALNSGAPTPNDGSTGHCDAYDQRGIQRQQCDRGAFEGRVDYAVNSTADSPDSNPGNGVCQSAIGGCTLRAALMEAGAQDVPIVITIPEGIYNVNIPGEDEDLGVTGDLDIIALEGEGRILIGQGPDRTVIRGSGVERVFDLDGSSLYRSAVGLFGMRIEGGDTVHTGDDGSAWNGGGARFSFPRMLTIDQVWFDRNASGSSGGGLHVLQGSGPVRITRSAFTRNYAVRDGGGMSLGQGKDMAVSNSLFADNLADYYGGGLDVYNTGTGRVDLSWITVTGNYAGRQGGGVSFGGGETLGAALITGNNDGLSFHAPDCLTRSEGVASSGYILIGAVSDADCVLTGDPTGNQIGVAINLSQVSMAGSDIPYAAPKPGSIAVGAVSATRCRDGSGRYLNADQLDLARPVNNACTIGAIEGTSDLIFANGIDDSYAGE